MRVDATAVDENRAGRLTPSQAADVRAYYRGKTSREVPVASLMVLIVIIGGSRAIATTQSALQNAATIAAVVAIIAIALRSMWKVAALGRDVAERKVLSIEGSARAERRSNRTSPMHFININGLRLTSTRAMNDMIQPMSTYRAYYLPRSKVVVNLEVL